MKIVTKMKILTQAFWVGCCNSALPAWYAHSLLYFEKQDSGCLGLYLSTSGLSSHINRFSNNLNTLNTLILLQSPPSTMLSYMCLLCALLTSKKFQSRLGMKSPGQESKLSFPMTFLSQDPLSPLRNSYRKEGQEQGQVSLPSVILVFCYCYFSIQLSNPPGSRLLKLGLCWH